MTEWVAELRQLVTVEPVIFWYMTSTFIVSPAYQQLIINKVCYELFEDKSICTNPEPHHHGDKELQQRSSLVLLLYMTIMSLVSIPPALLLGSWSDSAGRRSVMVLPSVLSLAAGAVLICVERLPQVGVLWVLASAAIVGLTGGHVSIFLSCFSYLADVTAGYGAQRSRTVRMAVAESMIFVGGTVGFLLGGFLEEDYGLMAAFGAYMACHVIIILYVALWLRAPRPPAGMPSPLPKDAAIEEDGEAEASRPTGSQFFLVNYLKRTMCSVFRKRPGEERLKLLLLIICSFLNNLIAAGEDPSILLLYLMYEPREFDTEMFGIFNSVRMLLLGCCLLGLFPLLLRCFGEMTLAKLSVVFRAAANVLLAFSTNTWMVFMVAVLGAPAGINQAVIRSLSSAIVEPDEQGEFSTAREHLYLRSSLNISTSDHL
ncbi:hypothetical protein ACEWY4_005496 [Coilia grayii]|uniref:Proton-coupled folate transporter n=1 Tax=Coilia grayii TaxID=363190 RepID=A0ABD1KJ45_9TELE